MSVDALLLLLVFLGIPTLIRLNVISVEYRLWVLFAMFAFLAVWGFSTLTVSAMGLANDVGIRAIAAWMVVTIAMIFGIVIAASLLGQQRAERPFRDPHFLFLFIPISIAQQFMYQSVFLQTLLEAVAPWLAVLICGLSFGYMHTIFPHRWRSFIFAAVGGIVFSSLFYIYPNFLLAALSHMILNVTAVYFGFFTLLTPEGKPRATRLRSII